MKKCKWKGRRENLSDRVQMVVVLKKKNGSQTNLRNAATDRTDYTW